jgi:Tfp pilus assembly protein PilV
VRRRGFSILEVLVMAAIAFVLLGSAWYIFFAMTKQSRKLDTRMRAIQASQLVIERLKADIKMHVHREGHSMADAAPPRLSLYVFRDYVYDPKSRSQQCVAVDLVHWRFSSDTHRLSRSGDELKFAQFESVSFSVKHPSAGDFTSHVRVDGVYVPEELLATPDRVTDRDRVRWDATIALPYRTLADAYGFWQEHYFDLLNF